MSMLFVRAIENKELLKFALGDEPYFLQDRRDHDAHWVGGSWTQEVMELHDRDPQQCAAGVRSMFAALVGSSPEATATRIWPLIEHLDQYWSQRHQGWLQFDLGGVEESIAVAIEAERSRCRDGESDVPLSAIELAIRRIQANGGLQQLVS